jgi:hypothetical protein
MGRNFRLLGNFRSTFAYLFRLVIALALTYTAAAQTAPASKPSSPGKPARVAHVAITLKEAKAKIVGAWARLNEDGKLPRDEKGNLNGSILSFDANSRITFRVDTNTNSRYVITNPDMSYRIEKDSTSGLLVLSGDLGLKFAIISIGADKLSMRYIDDSGKPVDWVAKWQRISNDPISPH